MGARAARRAGLRRCNATRGRHAAVRASSTPPCPTRFLAGAGTPTFQPPAGESLPPSATAHSLHLRLCSLHALPPPGVQTHANTRHLLQTRPCTHTPGSPAFDGFPFGFGGVTPEDRGIDGFTGVLYDALFKNTLNRRAHTRAHTRAHKCACMHCSLHGLQLLEGSCWQRQHPLAPATHSLIPQHMEHRCAFLLLTQIAWRRSPHRTQLHQRAAHKARMCNPTNTYTHSALGVYIGAGLPNDVSVTSSLPPELQTALSRNVVSLFGAAPAEDYLDQFLSRASAFTGDLVPAGCVVRADCVSAYTQRARA